MLNLKSASFLFFFSFLLAFSCNKEDDNTYDTSIINCTALKNNEKWEAYGTWYSQEKNAPEAKGTIDIGIGKFVNGIIKNRLSIFNIPKIISKLEYKNLHKSNVDKPVPQIEPHTFYSDVDDDQWNSLHELLESAQTNYIEITKIEKNRVWGKFDLTFVKKWGTGSDTIRFKNGEFNIPGNN